MSGLIWTVWEGVWYNLCSFAPMLLLDPCFLGHLSVLQLQPGFAVVELVLRKAQFPLMY
jgi:hypothetical protein